MSARIAAAMLLVACDQTPASAPARSERVVAVAAKSDQGAAEFCDVAPPVASAPRFLLPPVDGDVERARSGLRWINVWATWCPPCIDELPLLRKLEGALAGDGLAVSLVLLSVDDSAAAVETFRAQHPEVAGTLRLRELAALEGWLTSIGLDRGATLPAHVFVDAHDRVLCARTGAIRASDRARIAQLFAGHKAAP